MSRVRRSTLLSVDSTHVTPNSRTDVVLTPRNHDHPRTCVYYLHHFCTSALAVAHGPQLVWRNQSHRRQMW